MAPGEDEVATGEVVPGEVATGEVVPGEVATGEVVPGEVATGEVAQGGRAVRDGLLEARVARTTAFTQLYLESFEDMVRLAAVLTGSRDVAEDLVQDAFVAVHGHWRNVKEPRPYLRTAVVNACRSHHRRVRRERGRQAELEAGAASAARLLGASVHGGGSADLGAALARLPYRQRAALVLRYYDGLTEAEIAGVLGVRPGTVASLVHRALATLKAKGVGS